MLRFLTAGESHGPGLVAIVEGLPSGLEVAAAGISAELARRRHGHGRSRRMDIERDELEILGGVRFGRTLGSPVAVLVRNTEWPRWSDEMSVEPGSTERPLTTPRPGHADLAGMLKYGTGDARDILERASARETAARTVAGHLAKLLLKRCGVSVVSHVVEIGGISVPEGTRPGPDDQAKVDESPVRAFDEAAGQGMIEAIDRAHADRDTLGGVAEILVYGLPAGVGSHVHWDRKLDGRLAGALMSIPAIKAVAIGDGFDTAARRGSVAHDEISLTDGVVTRETDRAGGIEGGMSTGQTVRVRIAMKPLSTLMRPLQSVDVATGEPAEAFRERSDVCAVPAAGVVGEQMTAFIVADELMRVLGGDTADGIAAAAEAHRARMADLP